MENNNNNINDIINGINEFHNYMNGNGNGNDNIESIIINKGCYWIKYQLDKNGFVTEESVAHDHNTLNIWLKSDPNIMIGSEIKNNRYFDMYKSESRTHFHYLPIVNIDDRFLSVKDALYILFINKMREVMHDFKIYVSFMKDPKESLMDSYITEFNNIVNLINVILDEIKNNIRMNNIIEEEKD